MKTLLASLLATALLAATSHADVFIYRGVIKVVDGDISIAELVPKSLSFYVVVDYDGAKYGDLLFGRVGGAKRFSLSSAATYNFGQAIIPKGHTESFFGDGNSTTTNPTSFVLDTLVFHGKDQVLLIRKTPTSTFAQRPKTLKGSGISFSRSGSSANFQEQRVGVTFLGTATITGNNASKSVDDILNALVAELTAKGFVSL